MDEISSGENSGDNGGSAEGGESSSGTWKDNENETFTLHLTTNIFDIDGNITTTVKNADRILVLTENGIEESGTHKELMEKGFLTSSC